MANRINPKAIYLTTDKQVIYTSDKDHIVFVELWNESSDNTYALVLKNNKEVLNGYLVGSDIKKARKIELDGVLLKEKDPETKEPHSFNKINMNIGDQIIAMAGQEMSIKYNIIA